MASQLLDEREYDDEVDPKPLRVVVVVEALRVVVAALRDVLVLLDDRLVAGSEVESVADVPVREKIGRGHTLLDERLLVRVHDELDPPSDENHWRRGGHGSAPGLSGATADDGPPCGMQFGGGFVIV